ncbi:hypothetical protein D9M69_648040 [compost metagenome]
MRCREVKRDHGHTFLIDQAPEFLPVRIGEAGESVYLLRKQDVARAAIVEQPKQLRALQLCA